jgi:hypothetical protein
VLILLLPTQAASYEISALRVLEGQKGGDGE